MGLTLAEALRLRGPRHDLPRGGGGSSAGGRSIAFVGAGGKTTAIFQLARQLSPPVIITTTTHLGDWQVTHADQHMVTQTAADMANFEPEGVSLVTGPLASENRLGDPGNEALLWLHDICRKRGLPLLIEADGSHEKPLKAPAAHEPSIPPFVDAVIAVAGLSALDRPLSPEYVHRPDVFASLSGLMPGGPISAEAISRVLTSDLGGCKHIPPGARRVALLNQADTTALQAQAHAMVPELLNAFSAVIIASLRDSTVHAAHDRVAGIVLAAGSSERFGHTKQLLDWRGQPFVRVVAQTALAGGLSPVIVVTGSDSEAVERAVNDLNVTCVRNELWHSGQASSLKAGLHVLPEEVGAAVFLLADQPQISHSVIEALTETHAAGLHPIVAPLVLMERRANPVLFDRTTFPDLLALEGDVGGRAVFSKHAVEYLPWHDDRLLLDVDTEADYRRLVEDDTL